MRRFMWIGGPILAVLGGAFLGVLVYAFLYSHLRAREYGPVADVAWRASGNPMVADVTVRDAGGRPVPGVHVRVDNNSGGNIETTDTHGHVSISLGETDFAGLDLNKVRVVDRPWAYELGSPHVAQGLTIEVVLKDRKAIGIP